MGCRKELDAQRLRADTAEAGVQASVEVINSLHDQIAAAEKRNAELELDNKLLRHQLAACAQELRKASGWICREVEAGTTSATHWAIRLRTNADQVDAALNPQPRGRKS